MFCLEENLIFISIFLLTLDVFLSMFNILLFRFSIKCTLVKKKYTLKCALIENTLNEYTREQTECNFYIYKIQIKEVFNVLIINMTK